MSKENPYRQLMLNVAFKITFASDNRIVHRHSASWVLPFCSSSSLILQCMTEHVINTLSQFLPADAGWASAGSVICHWASSLSSHWWAPLGRGSRRPCWCPTWSPVLPGWWPMSRPRLSPVQDTVTSSAKDKSPVPGPEQSRRCPRVEYTAARCCCWAGGLRKWTPTQRGSQMTRGPLGEGLFCCCSRYCWIWTAVWGGWAAAEKCTVFHFTDMEMKVSTSFHLFHSAACQHRHTFQLTKTNCKFIYTLTQQRLWGPEILSLTVGSITQPWNLGMVTWNPAAVPPPSCSVCSGIRTHSDESKHILWWNSMDFLASIAWGGLVRSEVVWPSFKCRQSCAICAQNITSD